MLSRLSPRCIRLAGQGSLFRQCARRTWPEKVHTVAAQRSFINAAYRNPYKTEMLADEQDDLLAKHRDRVAKLSDKNTLRSKRELEYQMSINHYLEAKKEFLRDQYHVIAFTEMGPTPAWFRRISNIYTNIYETGDRMLAYKPSRRTLPRYLQYTPYLRAEARSRVWKVPLNWCLGLTFLLIVALSAVWLTVTVGLWMLSRLRERIIENFKARRTAPMLRDLEHKA